MLAGGVYTPVMCIESILVSEPGLAFAVTAKPPIWAGVQSSKLVLRGVVGLVVTERAGIVEKTAFDVVETGF